MLRQLVTSALLYTSLAVCAIAADWSDVEALREGDMKKLMFTSNPKPVPSTPFETFDGAPLTLEAYRGDWVVLNFWATWCAPCRHEMPMLSNLARSFEGKGLQVVTIATGRNAPQGMVRFFDEIGVDNLPLHRDPKQKLARQMAVLGLPITVIIDPKGNEVARMRGDAVWDSDSAIAILEALQARTAS